MSETQGGERTKAETKSDTRSWKTYEMSPARVAWMHSAARPDAPKEMCANNMLWRHTEQTIKATNRLRQCIWTAARKCGSGKPKVTTMEPEAKMMDRRMNTTVTR